MQGLSVDVQYLQWIPAIQNVYGDDIKGNAHDYCHMDRRGCVRLRCLCVCQSSRGSIIVELSYAF